MFYPSLKLFIFVVLVGSCSLSIARRRIIVIAGKNNSTFTAITQQDPEEYRKREYNETERWINVTKESQKRSQRRVRGEL
jgi:hypothetical protein